MVRPETGSSDQDLFDGYDDYVPDHIPEPGSFLNDCDVLTNKRHVEFHEVTRDIFEERYVYDMTFGYNLAQLNLDRRHPDAGYRYSCEEGGDVLRAEFTPTTEFCPQSHTLTVGSFRAWNGLTEKHDYDLVRVRIDDMHQNSGAINQALSKLEDEYLETGSVQDLSIFDGER